MSNFCFCSIGVLRKIPIFDLGLVYFDLEQKVFYFREKLNILKYFFVSIQLIFLDKFKFVFGSSRSDLREKCLQLSNEKSSYFLFLLNWCPLKDISSFVLGSMMV